MEHDGPDHHRSYPDCGENSNPFEVSADSSDGYAGYTEKLGNSRGFPKWLVAESVCLLDNFLIARELQDGNSPDAHHQEGCCDP